MISIQDTQVVENAAGGTGSVSDGEVGNSRAGKHDTAVLRGRNNTDENDVGGKTVASIEADSGAVVSGAPSEPQPVSEPGCSRSPDEPSSAPQPLIPRRFKRPPLLRARTTQLNLVKSPPSPPLEIRKHYGRSMSVPATAGDDDLQPCFLNMAALPETSVQNIRTHYYPEGGWGWCVLAVAAALHGAVAGLQTAFGALLAPIVTEFFTERAGEREEQPAARQAVWQAVLEKTAPG
ncbi:hypothetical protein FJT64_004641 [Amphibalanus amphitrite]|uniref:Uncharacterized protein n=1 Tax=Amphibalanus amphitrite TaxID=1232801 RepID=A0A6A4VWB6_AMPAM|nr:hypothetical protein FJT64_004641 [Amphibalanus amphitrite]